MRAGIARILVKATKVLKCRSSGAVTAQGRRSHGAVMHKAIDRLIINPEFFGAGSSIEEPLSVSFSILRMHKD